MSKKIIGATIGGLVLVLVPAAAFGVDAVVSDGQGDTDRLMERDQDCDATCDGTADGNTAGQALRGMARGMLARAGDGTAAVELADGDLSDADAEALAYMVEEEKLAHDLYVAFDDEWDLRVFERIAESETQHQDAVGALLDAYDVDDPTEGNGVGEFEDASLQELYDALLAEGLGSVEDALAVGALVEETDIADLQERATDEESIDLLFTRLETASANHLEAFLVNLDRLGVDYEPQVLTDDDLADLADTARDGGRMGQRMAGCITDD